MRVSEVMTTRNLLTVWGHVSVLEALGRAAERDVHHVLIVEQKRLVGVTCVCDLRGRSGNQPVREVIERPPVVVWPQSTLKEAAQRFVDKGVSCFPVCDGAELVGVVTRSDLRRSLIGERDLPRSFRCSFCGSTRHVRAHGRDPELAACLDCRDRSVPAGEGNYDEGVQD